MTKEATHVWKQIAVELGRLLMPHGFKKSSLGFIDIQKEGIVRQLKVQKFLWNVPGQQRFQLILSLYLATGDSGEFTFKGRDDHYSLVFQKNSGYFWGEETYLYEAPQLMPDETFFGKFDIHFTRYIFPFLKRCTSIDDVIAVLEGENRKLGRNFFSLMLAIALARLGRKAESRKHFLEALGDQELIWQIAAVHGINLDD